MTINTSIDFLGVSGGRDIYKRSLICIVLEIFGFSSLDERIKNRAVYCINNLNLTIPTVGRVFIRGTMRQAETFVWLLDGRLKPKSGTITRNRAIFSLSEFLQLMLARERLSTREFAVWYLNHRSAFVGDSAKDIVSVLARADLLSCAHVPIRYLCGKERVHLGFAVMQYSNSHVAVFRQEDLDVGGAGAQPLAREAKILFGDRNFILVGGGPAPEWFDPENEVILL